MPFNSICVEHIFFALTDDFDPEHSDPDSNGTCSVTIGLMQEDKRYFRHKGVKNLFLAIDIYQVANRIV